MKKRKTQARVRKQAKIEKPRRGRPRKTEAEKAPDQRKLLVLEIKADLKRVKKSRKRLTLLLEKAQAEQGALMAALLESLDKVKAELKKKPKKTKAGKRGRPAGKPGRKSARKPVKSGRKRGRPRKEAAEGAAPKAKRGRPAKAVVVDGGIPKRKRGRPRKVVVEAAVESRKKKAAEPKPALAKNDKLVTPIPKPGMRVFKRAVSKSAPKPEAKGDETSAPAASQETKSE